MTDAELRSELQSDPLGLGYAAPVAAGNDAGAAALLNDRTRGYAVVQPIPMLTLLQFAVAEGIRGKIEGVANTPTHSAYDACLAVRDFFWGVGTNHVFDLTDPAIVGATVNGTYSPGLLDALVGAMNNGQADPVMSAGQKSALVGIGTVPASRAEVLWGYGTSVPAAAVSRAWAQFRPGGIVQPQGS
jgi:hypothetical protein